MTDNNEENKQTIVEKAISKNERIADLEVKNRKLEIEIEDLKKSIKNVEEVIDDDDF